MAELSKAFQEIVIPFEGVYSNDSGDSGGVTVFGLTVVYDKDWDGWKLVDKYRKQPRFPQNLNNPEILQSAEEYYKTHYWDKMKLDSVDSQKIATELFDIGLNMGISIAGKFIQRAVNVLNRQGTLWDNISVDGIIGPKTISVINQAPEKETYKILNSLQGSRYVEICESNESQEKFLRGWLSRVGIQ